MTAETEKVPSTKKITVRTLATDINVSHETLIGFLQKKGYDGVKSIMSKLDDEMIEVVMKQFGKERDVAEKRQKKVAAFKERRAKVREEAPSETAGAATTPVHETSAPEPATTTAIAAEASPSDVASEVQVGAIESETVIPSGVTETEVAAAPADSSNAAIDALPVATDAIELAVDDTVHGAASEAELVASSLKSDVLPESHDAPASSEKEVTSDATGSEDTPEVGSGSGEDHHRLRRRRKTVVATGDPTDMRVTLPGLKIKGKIELPLIKRDAQKNRGKSERPASKPQAGPQRPRSGAATPVKPEGDEPRKKKTGKNVDAKQVAQTVRRTLAGMDESSTTFSRRAKARKQRRTERAEEHERQVAEETARDKSVIRVTEFVSVSELASLMDVPVGEIISKCIALGLMVSINQRLEKDTIELVADEFQYTVEFQEEFASEALEDTVDPPETLQPRPPVVTIMGHVDHGKTSLLDYIRKTQVVAGESGGITQHIGAYTVSTPSGKRITFLDTPGHEAFTAMRARGVQVTDIVVLVVAADDSVMPQTLEAISHARAAGVPIIVAINKIDRPGSNPDKIRQQLADRDFLVEEWGGKYGAVELSAKTGVNVEKLLERIALEAEILELRANPDRSCRGAVLEAEIDKGRGIQATVLIQKGTLHEGDAFVAGIHSGRVRAMFGEKGNKVKSAGPATPVQLLGFDGIPQAGDEFIVVDDYVTAKSISTRRQLLKRQQDFKQVHFITLDDISAQIQQGETQHLRIILKGDVDGSVGALAGSLLRLSTAEAKVEIIHSAVGLITENDVRLATASNAIILGFHVRPNLEARKLAAKDKIEIRLYNVIYDCINDVSSALEGLLAPEEKEETLGTAEVRAIYKVPRVGTVAGCYVTDGKIVRNTKVRLVRDGIEIFKGGIASLRRFKDDVREVETGFECGIGLENFNDVKVGDSIESYKMVEVKRKLERPSTTGTSASSGH